ncbi:MAG: M3 family metallopeptidase [Flavobacteriaceae bacterium]|nr:M3 family metallopeptidase [Flavobacteriaceae bacterium]MBT4312783.1 M3 family metallopeptidase [Flavobacteriaceae bacterium]MBT5282635.1 M3 family metallopeptidase [Flavobacteriaceae bacterium]MBT5447225.1 M3 family metallopeptidase [Flavobacteriaceae bacterium]MBT5693550.1 M3 family metallopeptidase [Flavobacteriaceae bacterium]
MGNPLLLDFKTPFEAAPFTKIKTEHFIPALQYSIDVALKEINKLVQNKEIPTFQNTLDALENCGSLIGRNSSLLFNLNSAETSDSLQKVAQEAAPLLTKFQNDIRLNETLFKRIQFVYENENREKLNTEQLTLLEKEYKGFVRNGALLKQDAKEKLRTIDTELAQLSLSFGENVLADTQTYILHVQKEKNLKGLPENIVEMAQQIAEQKGLKGWIFTLDYPSYVPFMTYSENRELRKELSLAFGKRGFQDNNHNNSVVILKIIKLRQERAKLLGYESHAAFVLEERMAKSEKNVESFLNNLSKKAHPVAKKEWNTMEAFAKENLGISTLEKWDTAFVAEKLKQEEFDLNEQVLKPYFPLNKVLDGLFQIIERLYGLSFYKTTEIDTYQEEVDVYEVKKSDQFHALLYTDFFPRSGKRNGAWMTSYRSQKKGQRPHISIVCNFSQPTKTQPSLLTFQEVTTLFHEFGHALHGILANTTYSGLSGTSVYWDFVELPSQIMENWCYEPEALALFAKHYETDEVIPHGYIEKIKKAAHFQQGLQTLRQLSFGYLDLSFHTKNANLIEEVKTHEKNQIAPLQFTSDISENCMSTSFSHIFQGGYAAGYYSYKWAEVLDADAFELFLEKGVFDSQTAKSFMENILSKGGTEHPMTLYKRFRGKEPDPAALLRRAGLA